MLIQNILSLVWKHISIVGIGWITLIASLPARASLNFLFLTRSLTNPNFSHCDVSGSHQLIDTDTKHLVPYMYGWIQYHNSRSILSQKEFDVRVNGFNWGHSMQGFHSELDFSISNFPIFNFQIQMLAPRAPNCPHHLVKASFQFGLGGMRTR